MRENRLSGLKSGVWKRSMGRLLRHRQPKGPATDKHPLNHRATPRLHGRLTLVSCEEKSAESQQAPSPQPVPLPGRPLTSLPSPEDAKGQKCLNITGRVAGEFHPRALTEPGREALASSGSYDPASGSAPRVHSTNSVGDRRATRPGQWAEARAARELLGCIVFILLC